MVKRKLKLKKPFVIVAKIMLFLLVIMICLLLFYFYQIHTLTSLGYSKMASKKILATFNKKYVVTVGENDTLNEAFESVYFNEKNLDSYSKIKFYDHKNFIKNINTLIEKGYSNSDINLILSHGNDSDVSDFAKRKKIKYLEEFYSISYAKLKYYDRYVNYSNETGEDEKTTVLFVNLGMDNDDYTEAIKVDKFSYDMLVNKHYYIDKDLVATDLVKIDDKYTNGSDHYASKVAVNAFIKMYDDAKKEGLGLVINSSYRSYNDQEELCNEYQQLYGNNYVNKYMAKPGFSEHQTGLSFDIGSLSSNIFANSMEYTWMLDNAYKYGFILRFPKKYESLTGFKNEPWHYRYVGKEIAKYIYENDISYEEYYAMFLDKD